ncbi:hypothetical protein G3I76_49805, partial [Streptomyces sp. SID11233]|nr:hypothetical protein [Streptomyces sp. SID11233]
LMLTVRAEGPETVEGRVQEGVAARHVDSEEDFDEEDDEDEDDDYDPPLELVTSCGPVSLALADTDSRPEPGPEPVRLRGELHFGGHG